MPPAADLDIAITWRLQKSWRAAPLLRRVAAQVALAEGFRRGRLSVVVLGARAMATLHSRYLDRAGPTDVLAFDLGTDVRRGVLDGEVVLCAAVAQHRAQAAAGSRAACAELALYLTHGTLHLAGYDDQRPADYRRMHAREDALLRRLGLGPVFSQRG